MFIHRLLVDYINELTWKAAPYSTLLEHQHPHIPTTTSFLSGCPAMKLFNILPFIGALVLGALSVVAQDATVIISGIDELTTESQNLQNIVTSVTPINAAFQAAVSFLCFASIGGV